MRSTMIISMALAMSGCAIDGGNDDQDTNDTNHTGGDMPAYCAEDHRTEVTDPAIAADGFTFVASDAIDATSGTFVGDLVPYASGDTATSEPVESVGLTLVLAVDHVDAVYSVLVDPHDGNDTGPQMEMPVQDTGGTATGECPPAYELAISGSLTAADGSLAESFTSTSRAQDTASGGFSVSIDLADVVGTARPPTIDPSEWDHVALQLDATLQDGAWVGSVGWLASNDDAGGTTTWDTATGVGTGTVGVSGMTEGVGGFTLVRQ